MSSGSFTRPKRKTKNHRTRPPRPRRPGVTSKRTASDAMAAIAGTVSSRYGPTNSTGEKDPTP